MDTILNDRELVRQYVMDESDEAFKELFRKHFGLVYATARRITRDPDLACDVAQCVFYQFARKAGSIPPDVHLSGWLHKAATFEASKLVRTECRRKHRELAAGVLNEELENDPGVDGVSMEDQLDHALAKLGNEDRRLVLLRFWQKMSARQMGQLLGLTEAAAQKRLTRALEKLRCQLAMNGVMLELGLLSSALHSIFNQSAPASAMTHVAHQLGAEFLMTKGSLWTKVQGLYQKVMLAHRPAVLASLIAVNSVLWAGVYPQSDPTLTSSYSSSPWVNVAQGWRNLSSGFSFLVDVSFTTLGIYPGNASGGSGGRMCN